MIYVDSGELSPQKKLASLLPDTYISVLSLEAMTGADIVISPDIGLPNPVSELWITKHIETGCVLIQNKIGHDLPQSIEDNRMKHSLSKMLQVKAMPWQCVLLFSGTIGYSDEGVLIDGQHTYGRKMTWGEVDLALSFWQFRGGAVKQIASKKQLNETLGNYQRIINKIVLDGETERLSYPLNSAYYEETVKGTSINPATKEWFNAQNLMTVDDSRNGMMAFPKMGVERVKLIWERMGEYAALDTFIGSLYDRSILKISGIGEGLWEEWVRWGCGWGDEEIRGAIKGDKMNKSVNTFDVIED